MPTTTSRAHPALCLQETSRTEARAILIVEDDPGTAELVRSALQRQRREPVVVAPTGQDALNWLDDHRAELVIVDLELPDLHGSAIVSHVMDNLGIGEHTPVLVLTGEPDAHARIDVLHLGAADVIRKPFDVQELTQRAANHLGVRATVDALANITRILKREVTELETVCADQTREQARLLMTAASLRSAETAEHMDRVGVLAARLAGATGRDELAAMLRIAAPLHDIGKIGIPDAILLKPGSLDPHERAILQTHPVLGAQLLSASSDPVMELAAEVALTHHERWDGTGYPNGLVGSDIPLAGRITAVVDVYDALVSPRPYKAAWPTPEASDALRELRGSYLDPQLVDLFLSTCLTVTSLSGSHNGLDLP